MSYSPFAKNLRWFFTRFYTAQGLRLWFEKKSGGINEIFQYKPDISNCKRVIMFLPTEQDKFFVILPFAIALAEKRGANDFLIITNEENRYILRALDLERVALFYNGSAMLYGEADFYELEKRIQEQRWDLCIFLHEESRLPFLYLAKITNAPYRMGIKQEFPFLNIALQNSSNNENIYAKRNFLYKTFFIDPNQAEKESIHITQKNERQYLSAKLSTSNTILLNLEPPINGEPWSENEIFTICKSFQPGWRIIAITATTAQLEPYTNVMDSLELRSNPVLLHSESIFSVLRQYPAIITLHSLHSHLFLNLSSIKVLMLEQYNDYEIPSSPKILKFSREGNYYSFAKLVTEFLNPKVK